MTILQRYIYNGSIRLDSKNLFEYDLSARINKEGIDGKNIDVSGIWNMYGESNESNTTIDAIIQILKKEKGKIQLEELSVNDSNLKKARRAIDTRLGADRTRYAEEELGKEDAKIIRKNKAKADKRIADNIISTGDYLMNINVRDVSISSPKTDKITNIHSTYSKILNMILAMKNDLMVSWYYNVENEDEIMGSNEITARNILSKKGNIKSKTQHFDSEINKTDGYCFGFLEHKNQSFNTGTRFTQPAAIDGALAAEIGVADGSGRRLSIPFTKLLKQYPLIMAGDLIEDKQEVKKMLLNQNQTPNKIFGDGMILSTDNDEQYGINLLTNYVNFCFARIRIALDSSNHKTREQGLKVLGKLEEIHNNYKNSDDKNKSTIQSELIEYINRNIAKAQFMIPQHISFGMKGWKKSKSPTLKSPI